MEEEKVGGEGFFINYQPVLAILLRQADFQPGKGVFKMN